MEIPVSYEHLDLWEEHSSIVMEKESQFHTKPVAILCSVGRGSLIGGILLKLTTKLRGWNDGGQLFSVSKMQKLKPKFRSMHSRPMGPTVSTRLLHSIPKVSFRRRLSCPMMYVSASRRYSFEFNEEHTIATLHLRALQSQAAPRIMLLPLLFA